MTIVKLRDQIISLETKNNLLQMNHAQLAEWREKKKTHEEFEILKAEVRLLKEDIAEQDRYIEHLEELLEFFAYKRREFTYTQVVENSVDDKETTV